MDKELTKEVKIAQAQDGSIWFCDFINGQWQAVKQIKYILEAEVGVVS